MEKNNDELEKTTNVEDLAKFIKESPEMKKAPRKKLSFISKVLILIAVTLIVTAMYLTFFHTGPVFKNKFSIETYEVYDKSFKALHNGSVIYDDKTINIGDNIVKILPFKDYNDLNNKYLIMLSEYGKLYSYNIDQDLLYKYDDVPFNIANIENRQLDIYDAVEVTLENGLKKVLGNKHILNKGVDELKMMDKIVYKYNDYIIYILNKTMYLCDYSKVRHYMLESEDYYATTLESPRFFTDLDNVPIKYKDGKCYVFNGRLYICGLTEEGNITTFNFKLDDYLSLEEKINLQEIKFTKKIDAISDYESNMAVRLSLEDTDKTIDVFLDKLIFGSLSNDKFILTYVTDIYDAINYSTVEDRTGNYKYEGVYYTFEEFDAENAMYIDRCVFLDYYGILTVVDFTFNRKNEFNYNCRRIDLEENQSVEKIYKEEDDVYITIKEIIETDYVVFDNTTETEYKTYLLKDFVND